MGNITTTPPTVQQAYEEDECRLMVWLVADTLTGPVVTPKLVAFTINKPATSPTLTLVPLWVFLSTTKIQSGFSLSALDNSDRLVTRHLSGISPNHFFFFILLPFLAETLLPSHPHPFSLWGVFESAEPRVRMFHRVTQINVPSPPAQRQSSLVAPSRSMEVRDCGRQEVKDRWNIQSQVNEMISLNLH